MSVIDEFKEGPGFDRSLCPDSDYPRLPPKYQNALLKMGKLTTKTAYY
jgi:hypothetical protein